MNQNPKRIELQLCKQKKYPYNYLNVFLGIPIITTCILVRASQGHLASEFQASIFGVKRFNFMCIDQQKNRSF